jgi:hypothetical protein
MSAAIANIKSHFAHWREWELNPIVIKELRQGVRSWSVTGMLMLFLVVLFLAAVLLLVTESLDLNASMELGGRMFAVFVVILAGASLLFIPLYTGIRVAAERQDNNPDLLYVSTLSPTRIILGKFLCSAYLVLLFFSACMPFMVFTNLLRGVDLPTVFFLLGFLFLIVCAANMMAIFLACLPLSRPFKFLFLLFGVLLSVALLVFLAEISSEFMRSGVGSMMSRGDFWVSTLTAVGVGVAVIGLLFVISVALISPPSANRALPVRLYLTGCWLVGCFVSLGWVVKAKDPERLLVWTFCTVVVLILAIVVVISNADRLSQRVRCRIPASLFKRLLACLFFNGAAGGLVWLAGLFAATDLITRVVMAEYSSHALSEADQRSYLTLGLYVFAYALTAIFIQRRFFPRRPPKLTGLLAMLLAAGWALAPSIFLFFANRLSWKSIEGLQLGNVFNVFYNRDGSQLIWHEYFAAAWLFVILAVNAGWFWRQWVAFRPAPKTSEPTAAEPTE